jgi:rhamnopyranosyl-N-acetylglucosaminyl-diphospho-decaprenol beta-1,3/1,4-galactofuranosyltransferase
VVDQADRERLAFPLRRGLRWRRKVTDFTDTPLIRGYASLFNGALFSAHALTEVGVPDLRLFIRGDETEVHRRLQRSGLPFGTSTEASYLHPEGTSEFLPILGGRLSVQYPEDAAKRYYTYRNRGYLLAQPGMRWMTLLEFVRFGWFFATSRNVSGLLEWSRLVRAGRRERFRRFSPDGSAGAGPRRG